MAALADFLAALLGGLEMAALAVVVGGIAWAFVVLRVGRAADGAALRRCIHIVSVGAALLALAQSGDLAARSVVLAATLERSPFPDLLHTQQFQTGLLRALLAASLAIAGAFLGRRPAAPGRWAMVLLLLGAVISSGAWLTHAASRMEQRWLLMILTTVHQTGAALWVGGVVQLVALWRLTRQRPPADPLWPEALHRFTRLGVASLILILSTAVPLGWTYVGTWRGLLGTPYGSLVMTKILLLLMALSLAAFNFRAGRLWHRESDASVARGRVPALVETETLVLVTLLFVATSVASQPPAVDTPDEQATPAQVVGVFQPRWPTLETPPLHAMEDARPEDPLAAGGVMRTATDFAWSNFSHNVAGLFLLGMGVLALVAVLRPRSWARHWPLGFVGLAAFIFLRSSGDSGTWPLGTVGFWDSLRGDAELLQHRLAALVATGLGLFEWRARTFARPGSRLPYVFPMLCAAGGILLLTHSHTPFEPLSDYLMQLTHTAMGALAVVVAGGRWLELRLSPPAGRIAGLVSVLALLGIGAILTVYHEPIV